MSFIELHDHAKDDLRELRVADLAAFSDAAMLLEQIRSDPKAIDKLTTFGNNSVGDNRINVKRWIKADPRNIWRLRFLDSAATTYRIVYGYHWQTQTLHVLAVVKKEEFDYDNPCSEIARRIFRDWEESIS